MRTLIFPLIVAGLASSAATAQPARDDDAWTAEFRVEKDELASTGKNPFFILEPGYRLILEGGGERVVITVLDETKRVDGVETRVVEERETKGGRLVEISRNYFAISKRTGGVYYFGEDVTIYKDGKPTPAADAWLSGQDGARFGLIMPGEPLLGARHYQEHAPKVAMDRAEIISLNETVKTSAREFEKCLKVEETTPLEPRERSHKYYAPGVGLVQDGDLKLLEYSRRVRDFVP